MLRDEYERGYDWFHQGESLLLLYFLAWPTRAGGRSGRYASPSCTWTPRTATTIPRAASSAARTTASDPGRERPVRRAAYPWLTEEEQMYGFPLDWLLPPGAPAPERDADPRLGDRDDAADWRRATPR